MCLKQTHKTINRRNTILSIAKKIATGDIKYRELFFFYSCTLILSLGVSMKLTEQRERSLRDVVLIGKMRDL